MMTVASQCCQVVQRTTRDIVLAWLTCFLHAPRTPVVIEWLADCWNYFILYLIHDRGTAW